MSIMLMMFLVVVVVSFVSATMILSTARSVHSTAIARVEASDGSAVVIEQLEDGYGIGSERLKLYSDDTDSGFKIDIEPIVMNNNVRRHRVVVSYRYAVPFAGAVMEDSIVGYAR